MRVRREALTGDRHEIPADLHHRTAEHAGRDTGTTGRLPRIHLRGHGVCSGRRREDQCHGQAVRRFAFDYRTGIMHVEIGDVRLSDTATLARLVEAEALSMEGLAISPHAGIAEGAHSVTAPAAHALA